MDLQARYDVAICGGGFVGVSLAITLAQNGMSVLLLEKGAMDGQLATTFDGRVSAVALGSKNIIESFGAWEYIKDHAQPILDIRVSDGDTPFFLHYDHQEIQQVTDGQPFGYIAENRYIRHGLHTAAKQLSNLHIAENTQIGAIEHDSSNVAITTNKGDAVHASVLVGADGKFSSVRTLAGIKETGYRYKQTAIVCTIAHENPHKGLAQERFIPAGPFAVLPMTGNRSSLVWVEPNDRVQTYLDLPEDDFIQEITERVGGYLGEIHVEGDRFSYPLSVSHARDYVKQRTVLVGDAAHSIHPIAGQGVNLGFRDVAVLSEILINQHRLGLDIGAASTLAHYQRWRRFDNVSMLAVTDTLNRLFTSDHLPFKLARGIGLWAVGQNKPLKKFFMLHAMGLVGDVPAMAKHQSSGNP